MRYWYCLCRGRLFSELLLLSLDCARASAAKRMASDTRCTGSETTGGVLGRACPEGVAPYAPKELIGSIVREKCGRKMFGLAWRVLLLRVQLCIKDCSMLSLRRGSPRRSSGVSF